MSDESNDQPSLCREDRAVAEALASCLRVPIPYHLASFMPQGGMFSTGVWRIVGVAVLFLASYIERRRREGEEGERL